MRWTYGVSNDENWGLELLRVVWGKPLNRTGGPSIRSVTGDTVVRIHPQKMLPPARTQESRWFQLDSGMGQQNGQV